MNNSKTSIDEVYYIGVDDDRCLHDIIHNIYPCDNNKCELYAIEEE